MKNPICFFEWQMLVVRLIYFSLLPGFEPRTSNSLSTSTNQLSYPPTHPKKPYLTERPKAENAEKNHLLNHFRCQQWHRIRKILIHRNNRSIKPSRGSGSCCISPWWPFFNNVAFAAEVAKLFSTMGSKMSKSFAPETLDNRNVSTLRSSVYAYATGEMQISFVPWLFCG